MDDLIRRKDAIDYFVTNIGVVDADGYAVDDYDERVKAWTERFSGIPSIETKRKGKWETVPYKKIEHGEIVIVGDAQLCSVCRHAEKEWNKEMKYCPNCGAEMRSKE